VDRRARTESIGVLYRGHEGVRQAMEQWLEQFDEYSYEPREIVDCGDDVLVIAREEGRGGASGATVTRPLRLG
jgi:hypothetical protein